MSLEVLESEITSLRAKAEQIRGAYTADARNIDQDTSLSDIGKRDAKTEVKEFHKTQTSTLRAREEELINTKIRLLEQSIEASGNGVNTSDIIAFRDAHDRADRLENAQEALPALHRALRNQDTSLAHAIFRRAIEANWRSVTDAFTAEKPELKDVVRDLRDAHAFKENSFGRTMAYAILG